MRWPDGKVICPDCGSRQPLLPRQPEALEMPQCRARQFSVKVGTIFEDSAISLKKWLPAHVAFWSTEERNVLLGDSPRLWASRRKPHGSCFNGFAWLSGGMICPHKMGAPKVAPWKSTRLSSVATLQNMHEDQALPLHARMRGSMGQDCRAWDAWTASSSGTR